MLEKATQVWNSSKNLCRKFSHLMENMKNEPNIFQQELLRTSLDISNDIAEWLECSNQTNTIKLYKLAKNKIYRLKNMLFLYVDHGHLNYNTFSELNEECDEMVSQIQKSLNIH